MSLPRRGVTMRVLVTGGAGYLGSVVSRRLLTDGYQVRVLDSLLYGGHALLGLYLDGNFEFVHGDIRSAEVVNLALEGVHAIVHLAAIVGDPACAEHPDLAREVNIDGSMQLFNQSKRLGIDRFVFASTCSNYGNTADSSEYVTEESELRPVALYAETKVAVERALLEAPSEDGPVVTALRFATAYGLSPRMRFDLTVNEFTMELLTKRRLLVYGGQFWRPYIHVLDVARAVALVLGSPPEKVDRQVFNVGDTDANFQKAQLVELICAEIGGDMRIEHVHKKEDPRNYRVSFERIRQGLGFRGERSVKDGIREIIDAIEKGVLVDFESPQFRN